MSKKNEMEQVKMNAPAIVGKITPKLALDALGVAKKDIPGSEFIVSGRVKLTETVTSTYGESVRFKGGFLLKVNDRLYQSSNLFLPRLAEGILKDAYDSALLETAMPEIKFAVKLRAVASEGSKVGYVWECEPIGEIASGTEELLALMGG